MSLEVFISRMSDFKRNKEGRRTHVVTELGELERCENLVDKLNVYADFNLFSGATLNLSGNTLFDILESLGGEDFKKLEKFIKDNNIQEIDELLITVYY
jgi:hypothetical protein